MDTEFWAGAPIIDTYSRAQAIADGVLVDVTPTAREAGFAWPVALSAAAWGEAVDWDESNGALQDADGRLWDVLTMARSAALHLLYGPGDDGHRVAGPGNVGDAVDLEGQRARNRR